MGAQRQLADRQRLAGWGWGSTTEDLVAFATALRSGVLLKPETVALITAPHGDMTGTGMLYGYGFTVSHGAAGKRVYGHAGGFPGVGALFEVYEDRGYVLAVLSNITNGAQEVGDGWRDLLRRISPGEAR